MPLSFSLEDPRHVTGFLLAYITHSSLRLRGLRGPRRPNQRGGGKPGETPVGEGWWRCGGWSRAGAWSQGMRMPKVHLERFLEAVK